MQHAFGAPEIERAAAGALQGDANVFDHRQMREYRRNLERTHHAEPRHFGWLERGNIAAAEHYAAARGVKEFGQEIEASCFAGAVGADHGVNATARDAQIDRAHRDKAGKILAQVFRLKDRIARHDIPPQRSFSAGLVQA